MATNRRPTENGRAGKITRETVPMNRITVTRMAATATETNRVMDTMTEVPMTIIKTGRMIRAMAAGTAGKKIL